MNLERRPAHPRHRAAALTITTTLAVVSLMGACAADEPKVAPASEDAGETQPQSSAAAGDVDWLTIEDETVLPVLDDLGQSLQAAHLALDRKDPTAASVEIRRAEGKDLEVTAAALENASNYLQRAAAWVEAQPTPATSAAIGDARSLSTAIAEKGTWESEKVAKAVEGLEEGCKELDGVLGESAA